MRYRIAVVVPLARYEVILVSSWRRCVLRGPYRMPVSNL